MAPSLLFIYFTAAFLFIAALFFKKILILDAFVYLACARRIQTKQSRLAAMVLCIFSFFQFVFSLIGHLKGAPGQGNFVWPLVIFGAGVKQLLSVRAVNDHQKLVEAFKALEEGVHSTLIERYDEVLQEKAKSCLVFPESLLPCDRLTIRESLIEQMKNPNNSERQLKYLELGYEMLGRFIPDDEAEPILIAEDYAKESQEQMKIYLKQNLNKINSGLSRAERQLKEDKLLLESTLCVITS